MDIVPGTQHRVGRAKGLGALLRDVIEVRHGVEGLLSIAEFHLAAIGGVERLQRVACQAVDQVPDLRLDDEHHLVKTGPCRVIDAVVHQDLAVRPHAVHLLVAAVAGAHTGRHDHQCRMLHSCFPPRGNCSFSMIPRFPGKGNRLLNGKIFGKPVFFSGFRAVFPL